MNNKQYKIYAQIYNKKTIIKHFYNYKVHQFRTTNNSLFDKETYINLKLIMNKLYSQLFSKISNILESFLKGLGFKYFYYSEIYWRLCSYWKGFYDYYYYVCVLFDCVWLNTLGLYLYEI